MVNRAASSQLGVQKIDRETYADLTSLVYRMAGIKLGPQKEALVIARVSKRMRQLGLADFREYRDLVAADQTGNEVVQLLDVITTNVTHFFREARHFELLAEIVRGWEKEGKTGLRIWSAAASSGEEPYSIAITLCESLRNAADVRILATDLSTRVLGKARAGVYDQRIAEKMPRHILLKYFDREGSRSEPEAYRVKDAVKRMVSFGRVNLACPPFPLKGPMDVIFCRNAMMYFDGEVRRRLLAEFHRLTRPGGYLMVGHAESLCGVASPFKSLEPSVYRKV